MAVHGPNRVVQQAVRQATTGHRPKQQYIGRWRAVHGVEQPSRDGGSGGGRQQRVEKLQGRCGDTMSRHTIRPRRICRGVRRQVVQDQELVGTGWGESGYHSSARFPCLSCQENVQLGGTPVVAPAQVWPDSPRPNSSPSAVISSPDPPFWSSLRQSTTQDVPFNEEYICVMSQSVVRVRAFAKEWMLRRMTSICVVSMNK